MLDAPNWAPTVQQVAARIMARTKLPNGENAGTFTAETIPTAEQVNEAIALAVTLMRPRLGVVADSMVDHAQSLAALRVAYMVELAYFPEQVETAISPYRSLLMEYKEELTNWDTAAKGLQPNSPTSFTSVRARTDYPGFTDPYPVTYGA